MGPFESFVRPPKVPIGVVAFSFGLTKCEPNPCNIALAKAVQRIVREEKQRGISVVVVAQWEITTALPSKMIDYIVVNHRQRCIYLDSEEVMAQAAEVFSREGVSHVIPVANPFLHLHKCRQLVKQSGFTPIARNIGRIGFCQKSTQWWTRGPIRLILYAVLQKFFGWRGR
ncbi:hypothetical protein KJ562_01485 [Patescibacteria group bacterium]|nr:hypothetical protein [Patescibacteria group bacterium]MBU4162445.1 hypothetical protein [Patescibacteria group bacterium]